MNLLMQEQVAERPITSRCERDLPRGIARRAASSCLTIFVALMLSCCRNESNLNLTNPRWGNQSVSYPVLSDAQNKLLQTPGSKCFWMGSDEPVALYWEGFGTATIDGQQVEIGSCNEGDITVNGHQVAMPPWNQYVPAKFLACFDTYFDDNAYGECRVRTHCAEENNPCRGQLQRNFPYCGGGCVETPADDTTYMVQKNYNPATMAVPPLTVQPTLYRVQDVRTLARQMQFDPAQSNIVNLNYTWTWTVPSEPDGRWQDNFSPMLQLSRIRAFIPAGQSALSTRRYLSLRGLTVGNSSISQSLHCDPDADDSTQITAGRCPNLQSLGPTYVKNPSDQMGLKAKWNLDLAARGENRPLDTTSNVFIEFTVVNPGGSQSGLGLTPGSYDFGNVPAHASVTAYAALVVTDDLMPGTWSVTSISTTGANASEFSARVHGSRTIPASLASLESLPLDLTFSPSSEGSKSASLQVQVRGPNGQSQSLAARITAVSLSPGHLDVAPSPLLFNLNQPRTSPSGPWRQSALIENSGPTTLLRENVTVVGPDAWDFRVTAQDGVSPVSSSNTLGSGSSEVIRLFLCPSHRGPFNAQLQVTGNLSGSPSLPIPETVTVPIQVTGPAQSEPLCPRLLRLERPDLRNRRIERGPGR